MILASLKKLPKTVEDLGKLIVAKGFKKLPKVQKIANSGHTEHERQASERASEMKCKLCSFEIDFPKEISLKKLERSVEKLKWPFHEN